MLVLLLIYLILVLLMLAKVNFYNWNYDIIVECFTSVVIYIMRIIGIRLNLIRRILDTKGIHLRREIFYIEWKL